MSKLEARKGIVLAGGTGSRLHPITLGVSKQLLPVFDKPMIYYPIATLMLAGIRDILIITTEEDQSSFKRLLGSGQIWGVKFTYVIQKKPDGIAKAFELGSEFIGNSPVSLILGDNIFYGHDLQITLKRASESVDMSTVFAHYVKDPSRYGIVTFDKYGKPDSIIEKPKNPSSNYALTGIYFYCGDVVEMASSLKPSPRGELEISDLNRLYLEDNRLDVSLLGRGYAWFDTGTNDSLLEACQFVSTLEKRQGLIISCPEEIALRNGWIGFDELPIIFNSYGKSNYGNYLKNLYERGLEGNLIE